VKIIGWKCLLDCVGVCGLLSLERTVAGTGFLAQASMPHLGKTDRGSPKFSCTKGHPGDLD